MFRWGKGREKERGGSKGWEKENERGMRGKKDSISHYFTSLLILIQAIFLCEERHGGFDFDFGWERRDEDQEDGKRGKWGGLRYEGVFLDEGERGRKG